MSLGDVVFDEEDMEVVVEPAQELARAFGDALFTTIHEAQKPHGKASNGRPKVYARWEAFAMLVCAFAKETE